MLQRQLTRVPHSVLTICEDRLGEIALLGVLLEYSSLLVCHDMSKGEALPTVRSVLSELSSPRFLRLPYLEDRGTNPSETSATTRQSSRYSIPPPKKKTSLSITALREPQISYRWILCSLRNFMYDHAVVSRGTDKIPTPSAVVLLTQKVPAIATTHLSSEIARQQIDICGSTVYFLSLGKINSKFHHKIFCRK